MDNKKQLDDQALETVNGGISAEELSAEAEELSKRMTEPLKTAEPGSYRLYWYVDGGERDSLSDLITPDPAPASSD